jgi:hypothetical protein
MQQLLDLNTRCGNGQNKVDSLVMGRKEEQGKPDNLLIKPMRCYTSVEDVILPKKRPPTIDPERSRLQLLARLKAAGTAEHRPLTSISNDVATMAWERRTRLDRPGNIPRIQGACPCPYCFDASPFQTFAYKEKDRVAKENGYESPDADEEQEQKLEEQIRIRRQERLVKNNQIQPLSIREALQETMPVRMRVKSMNITPSKTVKPDPSAVVEGNYLSQEVPSTPPVVASTPQSLPNTPQRVPRQPESVAGKEASKTQSVPTRPQSVPIRPKSVASRSLRKGAGSQKSGRQSSKRLPKVPSSVRVAKRAPKAPPKVVAPPKAPTHSPPPPRRPSQGPEKTVPDGGCACIIL